MITPSTFAGDWPQWRGPNRDAHVVDFQPPATWPKSLVQKWKLTVGEGVATPALVGDRLYVFSREEGQEVLRCLDAATGKELWKDSYESLGATGPSQGFSGPRSSPAVAAGKVVTVGVRGVISCLDAATGKILWRKDDFKAWPNFFAASSPLIVKDQVLAQLGGRDNGALVAYDLATGQEKWRCAGPPAYASPVLMTVGGTPLVVVQTESKLQAVSLENGQVLWESTPAEAGAGGPGGPGGPGRGGRGGGRDYRATTPAVVDDTLIVLGQSAQAWRFEKTPDGLKATELWNNREKASIFASPVVRDGLVFGLSAANELFCLDRQTGQLLWSAPVGASTEGPVAPAPPGGPPGERPARAEGERPPVGPPAPGAPGGPAGPGGRMRGGGGGFGSLVDAGKVLLVLTPAMELIVFDPDRAAFKEMARIKVADSPVHAHPVLSGKRLFVKDRDAVICWELP